MTDLIEPAHFVESAPGAVGTLIKRLKSRDWVVTCQRSVSHVPATLYVNDGEGYVKGDVHYPDYDETIWSIFGIFRAGRAVMAVDACWAQREGKGLEFQSAKTYDPILKFEHRMGYLKPRKPNEIEIEDDREPPLGLYQWLSIVAPVAPKQKGEKK